MKKHLGLAAVLGVGLTVAISAPAGAAVSGSTIYVPDDFVPALSDTRDNGSYAVVGTGLRIKTTGTTGQDKVAEYVATTTPLAAVGEPTLDYDNTSGGGVPGFQLVVDFDNDGSDDGILVSESIYGTDWWLNNAAEPFAKDGAPIEGGGSGSPWHGTLEQWRTAFPGAQAVAFGFSLGSGVKGDGVLDAIDFAGTRYTFAEHTVLTSKDQCKNAGWADSTKPVFKNQGDCVSSFASAKSAEASRAK